MKLIKYFWQITFLDNSNIFSNVIKIKPVFFRITFQIRKITNETNRPIYNFKLTGNPFLSIETSKMSKKANTLSAQSVTFGFQHNTILDNRRPLLKIVFFECDDLSRNVCRRVYELAVFWHEEKKSKICYPEDIDAIFLHFVPIRAVGCTDGTG